MERGELERQMLSIQASPQMALFLPLLHLHPRSDPPSILISSGETGTEINRSIIASPNNESQLRTRTGTGPAGVSEEHVGAPTTAKKIQAERTPVLNKLPCRPSKTKQK